MSTITIHKKNHAFLHVETEPSIHNELTDFFCFFAEGYQFAPAYRNKLWDGKIYLYSSRGRELPGGLLKYLYEFAAVRDYTIELAHDNYYGLPGIEYDVDMSFIQDYTYTSKGEKIDHRDYQLNAVYHALSNKRALLLSPTASGKSFIIYTIIRYFLENTRDKKVLIIVPTTSLVKQMFGDFADYSEFDDTFNAQKEVHCIYGGQPKNPEPKIRYKIKLDSGSTLTLSDNDQVRLADGRRVFANKLKKTDEICDKWLDTLRKS